MQGGSFVAATSSPPIQSTRGIAVGAWKGKIDRQLSLDRSTVSISGSFSQAPTSCQVPVGSVKSASGSTPWTPAPPRSPRQRTHSPLRWKGPQPAPSSALVLTRAQPAVEILEDRLTRNKSLETTARMPFLSIPSTQPRQACLPLIPSWMDAVDDSRHHIETPKRSSSPRQQLPIDETSIRAPRPAVVLTKDVDDSAADISADRLQSTSFRSPAAPRPVPRIASSAPTASTSPRHAVERQPSPFRWSGPQTTTTPKASAPVVIDIADDVGNRSFQAFPSSVKLSMDAGATAAWPMSAVVLGRHAVEEGCLDISQGQMNPNASARRTTGVARQASPTVRARTLSPARRAASRAPLATSPPAYKDPSQVTTMRYSRPSQVAVPPQGEAEVLQRPQLSQAVLPPQELEVLEAADMGANSTYLSLKPWLEAAATFELNTDFDLPNHDLEGKMDFATLMTLMKKESAGKWTIQTMADKLLLNGLLENLGLPHMPMIFASRSLLKLRERLEVLVDKLIIATAKKQPYDIIVKPTHLSSAQGVMSFNKVHAPHREDTIKQLEKHMRKYIETSANIQESLALQSLKPGFIGQPKYKSVVSFKAPLELKVCALWGKVRCGCWWWGTRMAGPAQVPHRNVWIVRDPAVPGELSENDGWEVLQNHPGGNAGWENAVKLFKRHMPEMAALTEALATHLGTPFLRADFFVGSAKWGVRLNEVAYGCGLEYRSFLRDGPRLQMFDDKPAMAEILRQGMNLCQQRKPPEHFLRALGVQGSSYEDTAVVPLSSPLTSFAQTLNSLPDHELADFACEENLCNSVKDLHAATGGPPQDERYPAAQENYARNQPVRVGPQIMHNGYVVKPHPAHIPTLMMPQKAAVHGHVMHTTTSMKAPVLGGYGQQPLQGSHVPRAPAMMVRAPLR